MSIAHKSLSRFAAIVLLTLVLMEPAAPASATVVSTATILQPVSMIRNSGTNVGTITSLLAQDQSGTEDTPANYVLFQTPSVVYKGYRTYTVPSSVSPATVTAIRIFANYKGPAKATQAWSWNLYDWVHAVWVKAGDNASARADVWTFLQFDMPRGASRFVNRTTRQIRVQLVSSNASNDAKLDYEAVGISYTSSTCSDPLGCVVAQPGGPIHISYLLNIPSSEALNGAQIALQDLQGVVNINGQDHFIQFDGPAPEDTCDPTTALTAATKMIADASIAAVIGTYCSAEAMAVMPVLSPAGFSMVSPSNTNATLTEPGNPNQFPGYFRVSWNDKVQGSIAAEYAYNNLGKTKAAILDDKSSYSLSLAQAFNDEFVSQGGTITTTQEISLGQIDMSKELTNIASGAPQVVYMPIFMPEGGYVLNQASITNGLKQSDGVTLMSSDSMNMWEVPLATGQDAEGFLVTSIDWTQFNSTAYTGPGGFIDEYWARFGQKPSVTAFGPYGYDALMLLVKHGIGSAAVVQGDGSVLIGRQALRDALYSTSGVIGLTGTLTCTATGDCAATPALGIFEFHAAYPDPNTNPGKIWP